MSRTLLTALCSALLCASPVWADVYTWTDANGNTVYSDKPNPNAKRIAELMQADLAKVGIKAEIKTFEWGEYRKRLQAGERGILTDFVCEARVRGLDRVGCALAVGAAVALAQDPHSLVLFDEVHEVEVRRERAGHLMCTLDGE